MQEDAILVQKTLEGAEQAFHCLIMKYYAKIYALILSWVKNPEDAKDLVQEVFLEAYLDLGSLRHHEQFRIWLQQIARHQCQDWLRKEKTYIQLDENIICETPLADELLILRETLAKVMKAIDELPESESQLLKERYLNDISYDDLEAKYGLSHSVLAMRLFRAREKVRQRVEKLLAGIGIFSWHDALEKMLLGGVEAVKISVKTKLIVAGIAIVMVSGGTSLWVWHSYQSTQETPEPIVAQIHQKVASISHVVAVSNNKSIRIDDKTINKQSKDAQEKADINKTIVLPSSPKESIPTETKPKERSPAELLDMYMNLNKSPEFQAELQKIFRYSESESQPIQEKFMNLDMREKELGRDLENASEENQSKIQDELAKAKADLWEADVELSEKSILTGDAIWQLYLRYFTKEQLRAISAEKERRQQTPFSISEKVAKSLTEAKERLKAKGWVSSNPNDR